SLQLTNYVKRPDFGKAGKVVQVRSNHFEVTKLPNITIYHYDISVVPDVTPSVNRRIFTELMARHRESDLGNIHPVFDGRKNMFSPSELPFGDDRTFEIVLPNDLSPRYPAPTFKVKIRIVNTIDLNELHQFLQGKAAMSNNILTGIMALDVLIRHQPAMLHATVGRAFYTPDSKKLLEGPLEAWRGYYQSMRPGYGKMLINVDITGTAFFQGGPLLNLVTKILNVPSVDDLRRPAPSLSWTKVEKQIKGLRVRVDHRQRSNRTLKIFSLTRTSAKDTVFKMAVNRDRGTIDIDVVTYFKQVYNIALNYPSLPCVIVSRSAILPLEVCRVVEGQRYMKQLGERQEADMIKFTAQSPSVRANSIRDGIKLLKYDDNEYLRNFGMKVSSEMASIQGRILPPPVIQYHASSPSGASFIPRDGTWNLVHKKFAAAATLGAWGVVVFGTERDLPREKVANFVRRLVCSGAECGMNIPNKNPPVCYGSPHGFIEQILKDAWIQAGNTVKSQPQLLICILRTTGIPLYAEVKRVTDTVLGVSSQCIQSKNVLHPNEQLCANVWLKLNVKLGGMNIQLDSNMMPFVRSKPSIILGGDVSHPQPGDTTRPSIAALVGSMDNKASRYAATVRVQTARTETIADLTSMTMELLRTFYQTCGSKPERILFYRDGVSEGQFNIILKTEIEALRAACQSLEDGYNPSLTFVVVQKRHHTRFFPSVHQDGDKAGNCRPGTVVDTDIVHPFEFDFYLQSHPGPKGTSRPTHYYVLMDDNAFSSDELQDLTYKLCHLYARCTKSVSLVPPAYYAHIVASRARFHARGDRFSDTMSSSSTDGPASGGDASSYLAVRPELQKVMWFM
ncbi:MAG: Piwi domain-containing protein, partial [Benniella sp.]